MARKGDITGGGPRPAAGLGPDLASEDPNRLAETVFRTAAGCTEAVLAAADPFPEPLRQRLLLALVHAALHLVHRRLALQMTMEAADDRVLEIGSYLARLSYRKFFKQDIIPAPAHEYFSTHFMTNYELFRDHFGLFPLPGPAPGAPMETGLADWLAEALDDRSLAQRAAAAFFEAWREICPG
ncbi:hypothetical protein G3N55_11945 [Dissulfurirhabdus thermomarina]|uniref:Uncharacterized protein n=1 Tax=Dissulfurirhabdus thermomarina TaxID=1765737 RepID=A0A6N9TVV1_DISTH|nr:hypothetical protein [Dissulfurirhabdus thermomarina]NDY43547.1 hypothetical protein [Dissulfurirhabdus thermomarina]NMX23496.1 hypothetical protein [Dissulfurirhabdus thermomarina]